MKAADARKVTKAILGLALLAWLIASVDLRHVVQVFRQCDPTWIATGLAAFAAATLVTMVRLYVLFRGFDLNFGSAVRFTLTSHLFNQVLPTGLGGDVYRSLRLKTVSGTWTSAIGLLLFERAAGSLALLLPALASALIQYGSVRVLGRLRPHMVHAKSLLIIVSLLGVAAAIAAVMQRSTLRRLLEQIVAVLRQLTPLTIGAVFALSMLHHGLRVLGTSCFLLAIGRELALGNVVIVMGLALFASLVPIGIGALGVREGILVYAFAVFQVPRAEGLSVALLNRLVVVILGIVGAVALAAERRALK